MTHHGIVRIEDLDNLYLENDTLVNKVRVVGEVELIDAEHDYFVLASTMASRKIATVHVHLAIAIKSKPLAVGFIVEVFGELERFPHFQFVRSPPVLYMFTVYSVVLSRKLPILFANQTLPTCDKRYFLKAALIRDVHCLNVKCWNEAAQQLRRYMVTTRTAAI
jgi:hypothetical protein